jgi:hypothetical protein
MNPYKLRLVQAVKREYLAARYEFCRENQVRSEHGNELPAMSIFSDKATFHINGEMIRHSVRVWGTGHSHITLHNKRVSSKVTVLCHFKGEGLWPLLFHEKRRHG